MIQVEDIQELHKEAMDLAEMAFVAKLKGDLENAENLLKEAYKKESDSAKMLVDEYDFEPTRSILFRSAASLAMECNDLRGAEKLIAFGLSGNPPEEIAEELRDLLRKVNIQRHLLAGGVIAGCAIVNGVIVGGVAITADELAKQNENPSPKLITIKGILKFADAMNKEQKPRIKLIDESGKSHTIIVPKGMLSDIVRPKWEDTVTVTGFVKGGEIHLVDID
ncbi:MAG: hypothetical protein AAB116_00770 [Candidatus Poribacteria bacterium]